MKRPITLPHFRKLLIALAATSTVSLQTFATANSPRQTTLIDNGWTFTLTPDSASSVKPFTRRVDLPHDWSVELSFDRNAPAGNDGAYLPTGKGVYTRTIDISEADTTKNRYALLFEGVYERWTLRVNGDSIGFRPYGYSTVIYDITPAIVPGKNEITVEVDNSNQRNSRWYTGSGIYRHVRLIRTSPVAVAPMSLFVTTPRISAAEALVSVDFTVNGLSASDKAKALLTVTDAEGKQVATKETTVATGENKVSLTVNDPQLWSPDSPSLYRLSLQIDNNGSTADLVEQTFGIRSIDFSPTEGFRLNGKPMLINGACVHHDNGILGAASFDAAEARKVRLLKEGGFNAVRTSHNPPSPAFLDECDRQGLLVIDEAFDGWRDSKTENDYSLFFDEWAVTDVADMVRRDRNHPSIIAWSIGNEVIERKKIEIVTTARRLARECRRLDPTRPVTQALCAWDSDWEIYDPLAEKLDITGYNYMIHKSESDHERDPERIMWQTESYPADAASNYRKVKDYPYIIGDFVWTGIDYLGESGIGRYHYEGQTPGEHYQRPQWPWHGAYCGDIDLTGLRKPISHYRDMLYNDDRKLYMSVREPDGYNGRVRTTQWGVWPSWESWNWKGHEGKDTDIEIISRYPTVRLYVNGAPAGEKTLAESDNLKAVFTVPYRPGTIRAEGIDAQGNVAESREISTAGAPRSIRLTPDRTVLDSGNSDIAFIVAEIVDGKGNVVPDADATVTFTVSGPGSVIASGSADLTSMERYNTPTATTWKGRALVAVKTTGRQGAIKVSASAPKLKGSSVKLTGKSSQ